MRNVARLTILVFLVTTLLCNVSFAATGVGMLEPGNWGTADSSVVTAIEKGIMVNGGTAGYTSEKFYNETFEFDMEVSKMEWPSIGLRWAAVGPQWGSGKGYLVVFTGPNIELQKYPHNGVATVVPDHPEIVATVANDGQIFGADGKHRIALSAIDEGDSVRVKVSVDGNEIINYLDSENPYKTEGFFSVLAYGVQTSVSNILVDGKDITEVEVPEEPTVDEDISMWSEVDFPDLNSTITAVEGGVKVTGIAAYNVAQYKDATYKFTMISERGRAWPAFAARVSDITVAPWGANCYLFDVQFESEILEYQKFTATGSANWKDTADNNFVGGQEYAIEITTKDEGAGVRWIVKVDGEEIYNILDDESPITEAGYFTINAYGLNDGSAAPVIVKDFTVEEVSDEEPVDEEPVDEEPVDEEPVDEEPIDEEPIDEEPIDEEPVEENPETGVVVVPFALMALAGAAGMAFSRKNAR